MKLRNNTTDGEAARNTILTYGTLLEKQLPYFFPESTFERSEEAENSHVTAICKYLSKSKIAAYENGILTLTGHEADQHMIDSIWAMIDVLSAADNTVSVNKAVTNAFVLRSPETICFIKNNQLVVHVISIQNDAEVPLLKLVQEKTYTNNGAEVGEEEKISSLLLIVIREKNTLAAISRLKLTIPHKIALLSGGMLEKPHVSYFGNSK